jgi:HAE1 family hydrophobic/amphiphilic exporter-1
MQHARRLGVRVSAIALSVVCVSPFSGRLGAQSQRPTLRVTADDDVALALNNNLLLKRDRFGPQIADLDVNASTTVWTPELSTRLGTTGSEAPASTAFDRLPSIVDRQFSSEAAWAQRLPWGSSYRLSWNGVRHTSNSALARFDPELRAGATATFVQPLLKGLRFDEARAGYRTSLQGRAIADTALNTAVAATRRQVLYAYWTWVYSRDYLSVQRESLALAQALLDGNRARVAVGAMATVDVIEAEAEVARRSEAIIVAEKNVANTEDVVRMLAFDSSDPRSGAALEPSIAEPGASYVSVEQALGNRQDLVALRASIEIDTIATRRFRNDTLPDASLRVDYSRLGIGGTELQRAQGFPGPVTGTVDQSFGSVLGDLARSRYSAWSAGLTVSYPIGDARAKADAARAALKQRQSEAALRAAEQHVATEVRAAVREADANRRRLDSTATAVALSERRLEAEQRKFAVGLSTSFFVFQAQRDLAQAREAALRSTLDYRLSSADIDAVQFIPIDRTVQH